MSKNFERQKLRAIKMATEQQTAEKDHKYPFLWVHMIQF